MRLSSLFTSQTTVSSALIAIALFTSTASAQDRTSEQGEAQITDATEECTAYYYAPVGTAVAAGEFPTIWVPATIVGNDTNAQAKYQSIQSQIPNIQPKGTQPASLTGDFSNFTPTYPSSDPDCWWTYDQCTTPKLAGLPPDLAAVPEPDTLGYGFDDGPNCSHNAFYDFLLENNQKATMFYIGSNVMDWPLEAQRGIADGHEVCVHTWSHRYMTSLTNEEVFAEFYYSTSSNMQAIKLVAGVTPTCWRPPFGDVDDRVRAIANALGLRTIIWKYDSNDWRAGTGNITTADVDQNYENLIARAQNGTFSSAGTIMLTHELNNFTMAEAVKFYSQLKAAFKYLVPMGVATNQTQPYVETNYSLPSFNQYISGTTTISGSVAFPTDGSSSSTGSGSSSGSPSGSSSGGTTGSTGAANRPLFEGLGMLAAGATFVGFAVKLLA
ncbi:carbohydrate esterase family 4 protein [Suillus paluster]|uniref:carbohydrate esterase family 4 protein n=1 Tax=Suillus paluster TaxID=48578 RepID=UPI001B867A4C|nr:carbohydrate esterase family 4 protein [Suillus paluster]KAG1745118.1 carbohydrate esterase family 4 protein [Suillus paluster]